jgi:ATP-dependent exoDNAse (exonuclease V) alpha subunit
MQATVKSLEARNENYGELVVVDDLGEERVCELVNLQQFGALKTLSESPKDEQLWDFGYALTVHKSQGSEWPRVCVLEQIASMWDGPRWRYTAATRASSVLTYCVR